jgi:hypothetical protein
MANAPSGSDRMDKTPGVASGGRPSASAKITTKRSQEGDLLASPQRALNEALRKAAGEGDARQVSELLAEGADPKSRSYGNATALMMAAYSGGVEIMSLLLPVSEIDAAANNGLTALMYATRMGEEEKVACLLAAGASPLPVDYQGRSALHWAAEKGWTKIVAALAPVSDLDQLDEHGENAERAAKENGRRETLDVLLQERARRERAALGAVVEAAAEKPIAARKSRSL